LTGGIVAPVGDIGPDLLRRRLTPEGGYLLPTATDETSINISSSKGQILSPAGWRLLRQRRHSPFQTQKIGEARSHPPHPGTSGERAPCIKLFNEAHASINVASTAKCSVDNSFFTGG
jgi:hypothetical protein